MTFDQYLRSISNQCFTRVKPFTATIYVGLTEGYDGKVHSLEEAQAKCLEFCNTMGLCVTVTPTMFVYKGGKEAGCIVGIINYPRFPRTDDENSIIAMQLAQVLKEAMGQERVTVVLPDHAIMVGKQ